MSTNAISDVVDVYSKADLSPYRTSAQQDIIDATKASDNSVVKLTGDQTISGTKTFTSELKQKAADGDSTITPSSNIYQTGYRLVDKNGISVGFIQEMYATSGNVQTNLTASRNINGSAVYGSISIGLDPSGNSYSYAPTPTEDTTSSIQIDTVGARNTKLDGYIKTDASNATSTGKETIVGWGVPDLSAGVSVSSGSYTPPKNGILVSWVYGSDNTSRVLYGSNVIAGFSLGSTTYVYGSTQCIVEKGKTYTIELQSNGTCTFYPFKGES